MIVQMTRLRLAGPRALLDGVLALVQDLGILHLDRPKATDTAPLDGSVRREQRHLERLLLDVETSLDELGPVTAPQPKPEAPPSWPEAARRARRVRRHAVRLHLARAGLEDERVLLLRYQEFFEAFEDRKSVV